MIQQLDNKTFQLVVASTPLISIDLIVINQRGQVLLGNRINRPAQGYWFVPGGRILKDETFQMAFSRLSKLELNLEIDISRSKFLGPYEHLYQDNFSEEKFTTHYVVLGYQIDLDLEIDSLPTGQHQKYAWWDLDKLLLSPEVHQNTKLYFL